MKQEKNYVEICTLKAEELFARIARGIQTSIIQSSIDAATKAKFIDLRTRMNSEFDKEWDVESLASLVNLSASRFYTVYKEIFLISPKKDLINIRIEHAESLLLHTNSSLEQIANMVGYSNQYNFLRQFKQIKGITPGQYRKAAL